MITHNNHSAGILEKGYTRRPVERIFSDEDEPAAVKIKVALNKYAGIDKELIDVFVYQDGVILNGTVNTSGQKEDAENIVFMVIPGINKVDNNLRVNLEYEAGESQGY